MTSTKIEAGHHESTVPISKPLVSATPQEPRPRHSPSGDTSTVVAIHRPTAPPPEAKRQRHRYILVSDPAAPVSRTTVEAGIPHGLPYKPTPEDSYHT